MIDENGCPTDSSVFPALMKLITPTSFTLRAKFNAFKFVDSSNVKFEAKIRFCENQCQRIDCPKDKYKKRQKREENNPIIYSINSNTQMASYTIDNSTNNSYGKNIESRDKIYQSVIGTLNQPGGEYVNIEQTSRNNFTDFKRILKTPIEIPLNFELNVKSPKAGETESLIYGENSQILVAGIGYDKDPNMLCMSSGVIVMVLLFWLFLQVILLAGCCILIKKYRKIAEIEEDRRSLQRLQQSINSDSLDRRVRWADQGRLTNNEFATT